MQKSTGKNSNSVGSDAFSDVTDCARNNDRMPTVLVFSDYYLPGYKAGGALRSLVNLVENLGDELSFRIVTRDRDAGSIKAYGSIAAGAWIKVGKAYVFYIPRGLCSWVSMLKIIRETDIDVIYLNSLFSPKFTVLPLLYYMCMRLSCRIVLAPRGELGDGALKIKSRKKRLYLGLIRKLGWLHGKTFQASTDLERKDILLWFPGASVSVAEDISTSISCLRRKDYLKEKGVLRIVFLSRISRVKNLHLAIDWVGQMMGSVIFDIYGPIEDKSYWNECSSMISQVMSGVKVEYKGDVAFNEVPGILSKYDLFLLPTAGENHGHVILEALQCGCLVLISDMTPWEALESTEAGWCKPLDKREFLLVLQDCLDMGNAEFHRRSEVAQSLGREWSSSPLAIQHNLNLLSV